jgi:hypothetical protein
MTFTPAAGQTWSPGITLILQLPAPFQAIADTAMITMVVESMTPDLTQGPGNVALTIIRSTAEAGRWFLAATNLFRDPALTQLQVKLFALEVT